ncbi:MULTISPECIES: restriction endonuclease subunit S [Xanthomonas]|nr:MULTISPECIES: restriction endonuclease subunit S [Xanthomonas]MDY4341103.1 restriction endonuclease subunit S [Xanthomonas sp. LF07-6]
MASSAYQAELEAICPEDWKVVPLTDVAFFQEGPGILAKDFHDRGVPLIRLKGVEGDFVTLEGCNFLAPEKVANKWNHFRLERGDLVISTSASFGRISVVTEEAEGAVPYTGLIRFRPKNRDIDSGFLRAFLGSSAFMQQVEAMASGSVIRHFGPMHLKQMALPLPPIHEQRAIGEMATLLAVRINNLRQTNATLEAIAAALFKSWFVDFDGVPPEDMQESELGSIPNGWRVGILGDLCELNAAKWTDKKHPPTVRYIDLSSVSANRIEAVNEFAFDAAPSRARMQLREGDTIVGTVRPGNRAFAYIHAPTPNLTGSTGFAVLSPKQPHHASFIYLSATRDEAIQRLANLADGAAYPAVRSNVVAETPCAIAPDEVIAEFSIVTKPMLERIEQNNQQAATLANLRDALLPRLLSGQLRVNQ